MLNLKNQFAINETNMFYCFLEGFMQADFEKLLLLSQQVPLRVKRKFHFWGKLCRDNSKCSFMTNEIV